MMKHKKWFLAIGVLFTIAITTCTITHITKVVAQKQAKPLEGVVIVLDAGHGGLDAGAQSGTIKEAQINLKIVKQTQKFLQEGGAKVILTRNGDYDLASKNAKIRKKEDIKKRMAIINDQDVDLFLSIHLNSYPSPNVQGAQAFYQSENEVARTFANIVQKHLKILTGTKMSSKSADYYLLKNAKKIGALVECGFLSNPVDRNNLIQAQYQEKVAKTLYESVLEYFDFLL